MLAEPNFDVPKIDALLSLVGSVLAGFDHTGLTYLDAQGRWQAHPSTIRDRISNELWFAIWEARAEEARACGNYPARVEDHTERIKRLFLPLLGDKEHWAFARRLWFRTPAPNGMRSATGGPDSGGGPDDLLAACKVLCLSLEHEAYRRNATVYVAGWDSRGKARRAQYSDKSERLLEELRRSLGKAGARQAGQALATGAKVDRAGPDSHQTEQQLIRDARADSGEDPELGIFFRLKELWTADERSIFCRTALVIAEEERIRDNLELLLAGLRDARQKDEARDFVSEQLNVTKGVAASEPRVLLRPCIEILTNPEIEISTGMQFEASGILGKLKDVRSTDALLSVLDVYQARCTDIRANIIYALGNLKQKKALNSFVRVLEGPDFVKVHAGGTEGRVSEYDQPLRAEKCEAIWALGKLGAGAIDAMASLVRHAGTIDKETRLYLAWALGTIGDGQKEKHGGIDAGVLTALMNFLTAKQSGLFEEAAFALKRLGLPDFLHTLYLHDLAAVPILSLKPSSTGLYELSETLLHLASIRKPVVMAVTGDSGTGKTYFCQTIANGFSGIGAHEILYLMRDRIGDRTLDRILGIKWLRKHNVAQFCEGYPLAEDEDRPDEFFDEFMGQHADKKLIILDGWRDQAYFHQVVRTFYEKGFLDVLVKFQTTFSTRRINLEEREGILEKVKLHLPLVEDPAIEETPFYKEGSVLIYNLDNSIPSRLNREEILQVFERKKVDTWADQIRIGKFTKGVKPLRIDEETLSSRFENISSRAQKILPETPVACSPREAGFSRMLNENVAQSPNLLQLIRLDALAVNRIVFYTHGQIACCGYDGNVAILTGLNDRILYTHAHDTEVVDLTVVGGDIYSVDRTGDIKTTSFYRNTVTGVAKCDSPSLSLASHRDALVATGHGDGTVRLWDMRANIVTTLEGHTGPVLSLAIDHRGRIYSGGEDMSLRVWDVEAGTVKVFRGHKSAISAISTYPVGRIVTGTKTDDSFETGEAVRGAKIRILNIENGACKVFHACDGGDVAGINAYFDGRLFVATKPLTKGIADQTQARAATFPDEHDLARTPAEKASGGPTVESRRGAVVVLDPRPDFCSYTLLEGHRLETRDCVTMGPRLITCGSEGKDEHTLRIWGTAAYVEIEHEKSRLMPEATSRPAYYRSLF